MAAARRHKVPVGSPGQASSTEAADVVGAATPSINRTTPLPGTGQIASKPLDNNNANGALDHHLQCKATAELLAEPHAVANATTRPSPSGKAETIVHEKLEQLKSIAAGLGGIAREELLALVSKLKAQFTELQGQVSSI